MIPEWKKVESPMKAATFCSDALENPQAELTEDPIHTDISPMERGGIVPSAEHPISVA